MSRLTDKGLLKKVKDSTAYVYRAIASRTEFTQSTLKTVINELLQDFTAPDHRNTGGGNVTATNRTAAEIRTDRPDVERSSMSGLRFAPNLRQRARQESRSPLRESFQAAIKLLASHQLFPIFLYVDNRSIIMTRKRFTAASTLLAVTLTLLPALLSAAPASVDSSTVRIIKPTSASVANFSGDKQYGAINKRLNHPLRVQVVDGDSRPVAGWPVRFAIIGMPPKATGTAVQPTVTRTDEQGFATTTVTLGSDPGQYEVSARITGGDPQRDIVYFQVFARKSKWVLFLLIGLVGGLGLFLLGMEMMSEGMKKTAGSRLRSLLSSLTSNRLAAVGVGTFVTMIIQSSSATTVMLVSFVQAQLISFPRSLGIILGADIGTTFTVQLIAFKLTDYALLMVGLGFGMVFLSRSNRRKHIGEMILGFGLLFFGMKIMSDAMHPLRTYEPFLALLLRLENPILSILIGTIFTAMIQSSAAFIGIVIILASQGLLTLEAGIPLLFGANLGTCITAGLASINTSREAKRVAVAHTLFKVLGILLFSWWIPYFADFVRMVSPAGTPQMSGVARLAQVVPRQIANAHTIFNVGITAVFLPFTSLAAKWIYQILPDKIEEEEGPYRTKFLDQTLISTPDLALSLAKVEVLRVGEKVQKMVKKIIEPFFRDKEDIIDEILLLEDEVDFLEEEIKAYLTRISQQSVPEARIDEAYQIMHTITELEQISDIVSKDLTVLAQKRINTNSQFSEEGRREIRDYHTRTLKQISRALTVFKEVNLEKAEHMEKKYKKYRLMEMDLRRTHFDRLRKDIPESVVTSEIHMAVLDYLKRISSHATNIARIILESAGTQTRKPSA